MSNSLFSQQLGVLNRGMFDGEVGEALGELVRAVRLTGKAGKLTIELTVGKLNTRDENAVKITPKVKIKAPELQPFENIMWSTADGDLLRDDPQQLKMALTEVPFRYSQENQSGTVEVPELIKLGLQVFHGGIAYAVLARLRYRLDSEGHITFTVKLNDPATIVEHAFSQIQEKMQANLTDVAHYSAVAP